MRCRMGNGPCQRRAGRAAGGRARVGLMARSMVLALLVLLSAAPAAHAEDDAAARDLYRRGEQAFAVGRFVDAANLFEKAFAVSGRPQLMWNIAAAWEKQFEIDGQQEHLRTARALYHNYAISEGVAES